MSKQKEDNLEPTEDFIEGRIEGIENTIKSYKIDLRWLERKKIDDDLNDETLKALEQQIGKLKDKVQHNKEYLKFLEQIKSDY